VHHFGGGSIGGGREEGREGWEGVNKRGFDQKRMPAPNFTFFLSLIFLSSSMLLYRKEG